MAIKASDLTSSYSTTKTTKHPHYDKKKPNEQHQFDLFYVPHIVFKEDTIKYILTVLVLHQDTM